MESIPFWFNLHKLITDIQDQFRQTTYAPRSIRSHYSLNGSRNVPHHLAVVYLWHTDRSHAHHLPIADYCARVRLKASSVLLVLFTNFYNKVYSINFTIKSNFVEVLSAWSDCSHPFHLVWVIVWWCFTEGMHFLELQGLQAFKRRLTFSVWIWKKVWWQEKAFFCVLLAKCCTEIQVAIQFGKPSESHQKYTFSWPGL